MFGKRQVMRIAASGLVGLGLSRAARAGGVRIDAAVRRGAHDKVYFFMGDHYVRYDIAHDRADEGYPKPINASTWTGLPWTDGIDTALNIDDGKIYFFRGDRFVRFDIEADRADKGAPQKLERLGLPWTDRIDAAAYWDNGRAYFFRGSDYVRYNLAEGRVDKGYPKTINSGTWPGIWPSGFDTVVNWGNGRAYFFKGDQYIRYDIAADRADDGYPQRIDGGNWPGLLRPAGAE